MHRLKHLCSNPYPFPFFITNLYIYIHNTTVESKAVYDDKFCGLMCDEDNQYDMSEDRAKAWVAQLKDEGFF